MRSYTSQIKSERVQAWQAEMERDLGRDRDWPKREWWAARPEFRAFVVGIFEMLAGAMDRHPQLAYRAVVRLIGSFKWSPHSMGDNTACCCLAELTLLGMVINKRLDPEAYGYVSSRGRKEQLGNRVGTGAPLTREDAAWARAQHAEDEARDFDHPRRRFLGL